MEAKGVLLQHHRGEGGDTSDYTKEGLQAKSCTCWLSSWRAPGVDFGVSTKC